MTAFAVALNSLFSDPNLATTGSYTPAGGTAVPVRVLHRSKTDGVAGGFGQMGVQAAQDSAELLQSEVPARPGKGATLVIGSQAFAIRSLADPARNGLTWQVVLSDA